MFHGEECDETKENFGARIGNGLRTEGTVPTALAPSRPQAPLITLDMLTPQQRWAMNLKGQILQTMDGGRRWKNVASRALQHALQHAAQNGRFDLGCPTPGGNLVASQGNGTLEML